MVLCIFGSDGTKKPKMWLSIEDDNPMFIAFGAESDSGMKRRSLADLAEFIAVADLSWLSVSRIAAGRHASAQPSDAAARIRLGGPPRCIGQRAV